MFQLFMFFVVLGLGLWFVWNIVIPFVVVAVTAIIIGIASLFKGNNA